jgi:hypothetical protein
MPVFQASPRQVQQVSVVPDQEALQPAPVDPNVDKIKKVKAKVEHYSHRLKCTSFIMMIIGAIGIWTAVYCQFNAAHASKEMAAWKGHSDHGHHGHHGKPDQPKPEEDDGSKYVTRTEFEIYDSIKAWAAICFFLSGKFIAVGMCGKAAIWRNRSGATHHLHKKSCFGFVLIVIVSFFLSKEESHISKIMEKVAKKNSNHTMEHGWPPLEEGDMINVDKRHLENSTMTFVDNEEEQMDDFDEEDYEDDSMVIIAGTPVKGHVAIKLHYDDIEEDEEARVYDHEGRHGRHGGKGRHGEHGKHGNHGKHGDHGKSSHHNGSVRFMRLMKVLMFCGLFGAHFHSMRRLGHAQVEFEKLTGRKPNGWGCGSKKK